MLPLITITSTGTGVVGESYSVTCSVDVSNLYIIIVETTIVKIGEGVVNSSVSSGDSSVSIFYNLLMTSHSGQYQCLVNISQIDNHYQASNVETFTINTTSELYIIQDYTYHRLIKSVLRLCKLYMLYIRLICSSSTTSCRCLYLSC